MSLSVKRKFHYRTSRIKSIDIHPDEPWILTSLFDGVAYIHNYLTQGLVKQFEVSTYPVRCARFIARKQWLVTGSDDKMLCVYNYNTSEVVKRWEGHYDYIRYIAVHPTLPFILTCADDFSMKLWDWENDFSLVRTFEGHSHYVMMIAFNPKDPNTFATAAMDKTIKIWSLGSREPNYTLGGEKLGGHTKGVNSVSYYFAGDKPYLISGSDDKTVKVWDYQTKSCVRTIDGHSDNVSCAMFHPHLPLIITGSEDGNVRLYNSSTFRLERVLSYEWDRVWCMAVQTTSNNIALGFEKGIMMIKVGTERPAASMDQTGKIIYARQSEVYSTNVRSGLGDEKDGEIMNLTIKEFGSSEIYPTSLSHSPNGRLCTVFGDGEFTIYMAIAWRNKTFGNAVEFVWGPGKGQYAIRERTNKVKIFQNFEEAYTLQINYNPEGLFGGPLLGVKTSSFLSFFDWDKGVMVRKINISPKGIYWSESGDKFVLSTEDSFFILNFDRKLVDNVLEFGESIPENGIAEAFTVPYDEIPEKVRDGQWSGDCFIYINGQKRLNYCVSNLVETVHHLEKSLYFLGYIAKYNKIFLIDKERNIISYTLNLAVVNFQTAILRRDFEEAAKFMEEIQDNDKPKIANFLESQGLLDQALQVSTDPDQRFDLAVNLGYLDVALEIAETDPDSDTKWEKISELAIENWDFKLAERALEKSEDWNGLLLLYTSLGDAEGIEKLADKSQELGLLNLTYSCYLILGRVEDCLNLLLQTESYSEAAVFARTYLPSRMSDIVKLWRSSVGERNWKTAEAIADPEEFPNLFENYEESKIAEEHFKAQSKQLHPASDYLELFSSLKTPLIEHVLSGSISAPNTSNEEEPHDQAEITQPEIPEAEDPETPEAEQVETEETHDQAETTQPEIPESEDPETPEETQDETDEPTPVEQNDA
eukprot:TRINITY_DN6585_c0_g1_i1.p1 TRINITY_DN6585_c0_g1~~TRINITY_DN6585_c0_g1_i1.p1  ORF type:complete len:935 (+),score=236.07 TRINITY_DN6585_c0_g1_i1:24-2807(+)